MALRWQRLLNAPTLGLLRVTHRLLLLNATRSALSLQLICALPSVLSPVYSNVLSGLHQGFLAHKSLL